MKQDNHTFAMACLFLALLLVLMYVIATPSRSQTPNPNPCAPAENITKMLKDKYGETPAFAGVADGGGPVLIFTNPKTGTFTITMRRPGGLACLMTAGETWTPVEQPKEGTDL